MRELLLVSQKGCISEQYENSRNGSWDAQRSHSQFSRTGEVIVARWVLGAGRGPLLPQTKRARGWGEGLLGNGRLGPELGARCRAPRDVVEPLSAPALAGSGREGMRRIAQNKTGTGTEDPIMGPQQRKPPSPPRDHSGHSYLGCEETHERAHGRGPEGGH